MGSKYFRYQDIISKINKKLRFLSVSYTTIIPIQYSITNVTKDIDILAQIINFPNVIEIISFAKCV